ncbi:MAG: TIR domain-containing protein [Faecalibacterium sp.]|nr:TIR domain-containing protein [Ruminococcus sp.]MCM1392395.1 TIR domain-containing protein [Ruminococcus sp.]MCM1485899.1 TIR domain-containing protein [Faecalibacterium sp.]
MDKTFKNIENIKSYVEEGLHDGCMRPREYAKTAIITARQGIAGERVSTIMADGMKETENAVTVDAETGNPGWIVTNPTGEQYIVPDSVFQQKYEPADTADTYKPKGKPITAVQISEDISFTAPWGEKMNIASGGYIVLGAGDDYYGVQKAEFEATYEPTGDECEEDGSVLKTVDSGSKRLCTCLVGLGGTGSKAVREIQRKIQKDCDSVKFIYLDSVDGDLDCLDCDETYVLTGQNDGCHLRTIGKDAIKNVIYNGDMPDFFNEFFLAERFELIFVTSTFGGFGSAAAFELSDFYSVKLKSYRENHGVSDAFECKVIAFPTKCFDFIKHMPQEFAIQYELNEIEFINEFRDKQIRNSKWYLEHSNCIPCVDLYVPFNEKTALDLSDIITLPNCELRRLDIKEAYYYSIPRRKKETDVFISYSTENQDIADMIVSCAERKGISCWIATRNIAAGSYAQQIAQAIRKAKIFVVLVSSDAMLSPHVKNELDLATPGIKEGLTIMPFRIDSAELDDEFRYYLGRHEFFDGYTPPFEDRVERFVEGIRSVLNK